MSYYLKDPGASVDYAFDWNPWLGGGGAIASSEWSILPAEAGGLAKVSDGFTTGRTTATMSGGLRGRIYRVSNKVTLADGRRDERTLAVRVEER